MKRRRMSRAALVLAASILGPAVRSAPDDPGPAWRDGPVSYVLSQEDYRLYGRQDTPDARRAFVDAFWSRLDPDPTTALNEYRARFTYLVEVANERFEGAVSPGWRTDRGKVLILLGIPDSVERDAGDARGGDREIWKYRRPPGGGVSPMEIVFYRGEDGEFGLRPDHAVEDRVAESLTEIRELASVWSRYSQRIYAGLLHNSDIETLRQAMISLDIGRSPFQAVPAERPVSRPGPSRAGRPEPGASLAPEFQNFEEDEYFFRAADGSVLAMLSLGYRPETVPDAGRDASTAFAWILRRSGGSRSGISVVPMRRRAEPGCDGSLLFAGSLYLDPGIYEVRYALREPARERVLLRTTSMVVPELAATPFSASSVVPAETFGPAEGTRRTPFRVGSEEVVPRPAGVFHRGEPLRLYFQVYGAVPDPSTGTPSVDVLFRFQRSHKGGYRRHRKPLSVRGARGGAMGLALPIGDWPVGTYRVQVDLRDRVSGSRTSTEGFFRVIDRPR